MKVVNKKELAQLPNGTFFYELNEYGNIRGGLEVLDSYTRFRKEDGTITFNGVTYLKPDNDCDNGCVESFFDNVPDKLDILNIDTTEMDFNDDEKFLVLSIEESKELVSLLEKYVKMAENIPVTIIDECESFQPIIVNEKSIKHLKSNITPQQLEQFKLNFTVGKKDK